VRILTDIGMIDDSTQRRTISAARSGLSIKATPCPDETALLAGHPKFILISSGRMGVLQYAPTWIPPLNIQHASAISSGFFPKICITNGLSSSEKYNIFSNLFPVEANGRSPLRLTCQ